MAIVYPCAAKIHPSDLPRTKLSQKSFKKPKEERTSEEVLKFTSGGL